MEFAAADSGGWVVELSGSAARDLIQGVNLSGHGRLWSWHDELVGEGRYCIFRDGSGWFACDISLIDIGDRLWLELETGERGRVKVSRKATRNVLFRPDPPTALPVDPGPM